MSTIFYIIFSYICLASLIVFLSIKLSDYIDQLDRKTNISSAFLGGVLLAIVTSLPELFTSISSILFLNESGMVIGNIMGSNSFDILILGFCIIAFYKMYKNDNLEIKSHIIVLCGLVLMYICLFIPLLIPSSCQPVLGHINVFFIVIAIIYVLVLWKMPKTVKDKDFGDDEKKEVCEVDNLKPELSVKQIVFRFVICAISLVAVSILITYTTNDIAKYFDLESSTAGALFLAIATSLPEVVSTIALCAKGNFDASFGNILGSCLFNTFVLTLAELISFKSSILIPNDKASLKLVVLNLVSVATCIVVVLLRKSKKEFKGTRIVNYLLASILILAYLMYYMF